MIYTTKKYLFFLCFLYLLILLIFQNQSISFHQTLMKELDSVSYLYILYIYAINSENFMYETKYHVPKCMS